MAKKVVVEIVSDLTGAAIPDGDVCERDFVHLSQQYHLDLTPAEAADYDKSMQIWADHATPVKGRANGHANGQSNGGVKKPSNAGIHAWMRKEGYEVRGPRVAPEIVEKFQAAKARGEV